MKILMPRRYRNTERHFLPGETRGRPITQHAALESTVDITVGLRTMLCDICFQPEVKCQSI